MKRKLSKKRVKESKGDVEKREHGKGEEIRQKEMTEEKRREVDEIS